MKKDVRSIRSGQQCHKKGAGSHQHQSEHSFFAQLFFKDQIRQGDRDKDAQFVNRNNNTYDTILDRIVIAKPGRTGRQSGKKDIRELFLADTCKKRHLSFEKYDHPCHQKDDSGADGSAEVGFHTCNSNLGKQEGGGESEDEMFPLSQTNDRKQDRKYGAGFVDRDHFVYIAQRQCFEIADPGSACGETGKD